MVTQILNPSYFSAIAKSVIKNRKNLDGPNKILWLTCPQFFYKLTYKKPTANICPLGTFKFIKLRLGKSGEIPGLCRNCNPLPAKAGGASQITKRL